MEAPEEPADSCSCRDFGASIPKLASPIQVYVVPWSELMWATRSGNAISVLIQPLSLCYCWFLPHVTSGCSAPQSAYFMRLLLGHCGPCSLGKQSDLTAFGKIMLIKLTYKANFE